MKTSSDPNLTDRVARVLERHGYTNRQEPLVAAVSGGPDSLCLFDTLLELRQTLGLVLHIAHLDHGLRGKESQRDAQYVKNLAKASNVPVTIGQRNVRDYQKTHSLTLEEAARDVRYAFLTQVTRSVGGNTIVLGHSADDQAETVFMHILRGSGLRGIGGMREISQRYSHDQKPLTLLRPLLEVNRAEIEAYCKDNGIHPRNDPSNTDIRYHRNAIRNKILPYLQQFNPSFKKALLRLAKSSQQDMNFIDEELSGVWESLVKISGDTLTIRSDAKNLPTSLQHHLVHKVVSHLNGNQINLESIHVEATISLLHGGAGRSTSLPGSLVATSTYHGIDIGPSQALECPFPILEGEQRLTIPGETILPGWKATALIEKGPRNHHSEASYVAEFDADKVGRELVVRTRQRGDSFQPLGMDGEKKLQDFMVDAKIPKTWRDRTPLVWSPQGIIWIVGHRIDQRASVSSSTSKILQLRFEPA